MKLNKQSILFIILGLLATGLLLTGIFYLSQSQQDTTVNVTTEVKTEDGVQKEITDDMRTNMSNMTFVDADNKSVSIKDIANTKKPTFVMFWASWCPYCKAQLPIVKELHQQYGDNVNFVLLDAVDNKRETAEQGKKFLKENNYPFAYYADNQLVAARSMKVSYLPTMFILDSEGTMTHAYDSNQSKEELEKTINALL